MSTEERTNEFEFRHGVLVQKWLIRTFEGGYWRAEPDEWRPIPGQAASCSGHKIDYNSDKCEYCGWSSLPEEA